MSKIVNISVNTLRRTHKLYFVREDDLNTKKLDTIVYASNQPSDFRRFQFFIYGIIDIETPNMNNKFNYYINNYSTRFKRNVLYTRTSNFISKTYIGFSSTNKGNSLRTGRLYTIKVCFVIRPEDKQTVYSELNQYLEYIQKTPVANELTTIEYEYIPTFMCYKEGGNTSLLKCILNVPEIVNMQFNSQILRQLILYIQVKIVSDCII